MTFFDVTEQRTLNNELKEANSKLCEKSEELAHLLNNLSELNTKLKESEARYKLISDYSNGWETFRHPMVN
ncbi:MAG: hypothetical protein HC831_22585 [Chloroflexia bacterium]|nr:hypothetical protein [Chloroflexia bacterium]